ncbi:enoyl-CoA hydratase-related protein [Geomonas sp. RF6]|uniref:enoyl-CoA hydratase/isomerase family protein n=1 Tax=Geomonas sp. RF6 TaxID=2897342 RepID=UPI001E403876|nr:enoyl-CoA hydratase-related protein [Geomonas sp. RF6]UFS69450.1 enoyl-CoA hydratase-related protein [Geomonas sp. RF6]
MYTENDMLELVLEEGIVTLSLKECPLNVDLLRVLGDTFARLAGDRDVAGILITSFGPEADAPHSLAPSAYAQLGQQVMFALEGVGKPVIAAASGPTVGAAFELALACDFIVASPSASFGFPGILRGELPCFGGTQRLTKAVGKARAKEMLFTGAAIGVDEGLAHGLVNRIYPDDEVISAARGLLATICNQGTLAIRMAKEIVDAGHGLDLRRGCLLERDAFALCFATEDQREGMGSFLERRPANFKGK